MYNTFVESLHRLYDDDQLSLSRIDDFLENRKITQTDYDYIVNRENNKNKEYGEGKE